MYQMGMGVTLFAVLLVGTATAQELVNQNRIAICSDTKNMMKILKDAGETEYGVIGFIDPENLDKKKIQIVIGSFRNPETGSFSIVETSTTGISCVTHIGMSESHLKY